MLLWWVPMLKTGTKDVFEHWIEGFVFGRGGIQLKIQKLNYIFYDYMELN